MTQNQPIALRMPQMSALLEQSATLDRRTQQILAQQVQAMVYQAEESKAAQDAMSLLYTYVVAKAQETLTTAEVIKALRSPFTPATELEGLEEALRQRYLANIDRIANVGNQRILSLLTRSK